MNAVDSSVVVAAFASWHEHHEAARRVVDRGPRLVAHCALEAYSVLTRLPPPHRASAGLVQEFLATRFEPPYLVLSAAVYPALVDRLAREDIVGGATYDALIAAVATESGATLVTCDRRAVPTYERLGARIRLVP